MNEYGTILDVERAALHFALGFLPELPDADDVMLKQAQTGYSAAPDVYDDAPQSMTSTPPSRHDAYEQAVYWLSLGSRRAWNENNKSAANSLLAAAEAINGTWEASGSLTVLGTAISTLEASQLADVDKLRIIVILEANKMGVWQREIIRWGLIGTVTVGVGYWLWRRQRSG